MSNTPTQNTPHKKTLSIGVAVAIVVLVSAALLRLVHIVKPQAPLPLLASAPGLIELHTIEEITAQSTTSVIPPKRTFDAELATIGIYPDATKTIPAGMVTLVYTREHNRFVEIDYRPGTNAEKELTAIGAQQSEQIILMPQVKATFVRMRKFVACKSPVAEQPGVCQFTRAIVFDLLTETVVLFADGEHATDGELIEMARSIVDAGSFE
ncbi:hypothetical protein HZA85_01600 [Candidatus Uhrbacteria bacterium]|nr:hypothetical protein [Candidatus Uhrbacteria bacterium]